MANTYTSLHYHMIFSTKNREPWLVTDIEQRVWEFIGGIARAHGMTALQVGGVEDHYTRMVLNTTNDICGDDCQSSLTRRNILCGMVTVA